METVELNLGLRSPWQAVKELFKVIDVCYIDEVVEVASLVLLLSCPFVAWDVKGVLALEVLSKELGKL